MEVLQETPQRRGFLENWLRWFLWITAFGAGYHGGQMVMITMHGHFDMGVVIFTTGVMGYAIAGVILGAVIALLVTLVPKLRIAPTTLAMGAIRIVIIGLALGIWSGFVTKLPGMADESQSPATACTAANIESQFAEMKVIDNAIGQNGVAPKSLVAKTDHLWTRMLDCEGHHSELTDEQHGKYIDIILLGSADSVVVYYDANRIADAKKYLSIYFDVVQEMKPLAKSKGWTKMIGYMDTVSPLMEKYAKLLNVPAQ
jgi:hypothetical protein